MKSTMEALFKRLKNEDENYLGEIGVIATETNEISPGYQELCKNYSDTVKDYTETRDLVIGDFVIYLYLRSERPCL